MPLNKHCFQDLFRSASGTNGWRTDRWRFKPLQWSPQIAHVSEARIVIKVSTTLCQILRQNRRVEYSCGQPDPSVDYIYGTRTVTSCWRLRFSDTLLFEFCYTLFGQAILNIPSRTEHFFSLRELCLVNDTLSRRALFTGSFKQCSDGD